MRELFFNIGLKTLEGDEVFYFLNEGGKFKGAVLTHVDDFTLARNDAFLKIVIEVIETCKNVYKVKENNFRYTGLDVERHPGEISVSMDDYVNSLLEVKKIRKVSGALDFIKLEMIQYRKMAGKFNWLAQSTRPDLGYTSLKIAKRNNDTKISNLKNIYFVLKKVER